MSQIIQTIEDRTIQTDSARSDAKNAPLTNTSFEWTELAGLSWIFQEHSFEDYT